VNKLDSPAVQVTLSAPVICTLSMRDDIMALGNDNLTDTHTVDSLGV
ncbi:unnamed protein product, partial [marine sediment metagenome]